MRIIFVCLGNIVRSPLAENLFKQKVLERNLEEKYSVDSAGTSAWHIGERPDSRMRAVARECGLVYDGSARQFTQIDFERFDLVIAMDASNNKNLMELANSKSDEEKIQLLRKFDVQKGNTLSVPDPYYGGIDGFEKVFHIIDQACEGLLDYLEEQNDTK